MTRNETPPDQNGGSGQWLKSNLSALGSATVFAVYAAGFVRTKAAAASLAVEPVRRVQAATLAPPSAVPSTTPAADTVATVAKPVEKPVANAAPKSATPPVDKAPSAAMATVATPAPVTAAATPVPSVPQATVSAATAAPIKAAPVTPAPVATPTPVPVAPAQVPAPVPVPVPAPTTPAAVAAPAAAPAADAAPARVGFKDGTFVGYGRSNHGDVEATVDIVDGQIVDAYITKCLTEYSCSWIVALPPQVSQRQSAEVDIVSGATASSNAFYAAIKQALAKAK